MSEHVTREEFEDALEDINERISGMATQTDVEALTTTIKQVATDLDTAQAALQAEIDKLAAANPGLDLSGLTAVVAPLDAHAKALAALVPTPPAPAAQTVYTFSGDPAVTPIDPAVWLDTGHTTNETPPRKLYHFAQDTAPGDAKGSGLDNGAWVVYTGPVV